MFFFYGIFYWWPLTIIHWIYLDSLVLTEVIQRCEAIWRHVGLFSCHCWHRRRLLLFGEAVYYWNPFTTCCCHFGVTHLWWLWFKGLYIISISVWFNPPRALRDYICKQFFCRSSLIIRMEISSSRASFTCVSYTLHFLQIVTSLLSLLYTEIWEEHSPLTSISSILKTWNLKTPLTQSCLCTLHLVSSPNQNRRLMI